ncbi:cytochrome c-type biogenesis protein [Aquabacter cavernae]|uniref:cytochrome c-type biogenesis protein n=1 Tax=Aquabacter cavernae TaxID=2496029 RepID=UPI001AEC754C|nr:cytochrome c-type biogenesis protein [Aquabacter cavernae]
MGMRFPHLSALLLGLSLLVSPAFAVQPDEVLPDPAMEQRARDLSRELRCMVCQNQSIDDSDAPLARDLRILVRERLKAGDSNGQVLDYLVARYGEFVLMRPVFSWRNALLWGFPVLVLVLGAALAASVMRRRATASPPAPLSAAEEARMAQLLADAPQAGRNGDGQGGK